MHVDNRYRLGERIATDASGVLWRGWDERLDRAVAVKVFDGSVRDSSRWDRFVREARILGGLDAPGLVPLFDVRTDVDAPYMVMGQLEGEPLSHRLLRGPLPNPLAWRVTFDLLTTIQVAHDFGFVHREIRPEHVFLRDDDADPRVRLLGFGRVRAVGEDGTFSEFDNVSSIPPHTAPELFLEDAIDPRTDVYGIAAVAYHAFTGRPPVDLSACRNIAEALQAIMSDATLPLSKVDARLGKLDGPLLRALAKTPSRRTASLLELRAELEAAKHARKTRRSSDVLRLPGVGDMVDGYRIVGELGSGSMGTVYLGQDVQLNRHVAIKFLHALSERRRARFVEEARGMAQVQHPNVVQVHAFGVHEELPYLIMENVPGQSVEQARRGELPIEDALSILDQTAAGLEAVHQAGLTHGDVKPGNVLIGPAFRVCVADFGLVRPREDFAEDTPLGGTPAYMAPERLGQTTPELAHRADVYALGVMAYELLAGRLPFETDDPSPHAMFELHRSTPPPRVSEAGVHPAFDEVVLRALTKDPAERLPSAAQFRLDLARAAREAWGEHPAPRFLIVDPDEVLAYEVQQLFPDAVLRRIPDGSRALEELGAEGVDVMLYQHSASHAGVELAARIRAQLAEPPPLVIVINRNEEVDLEQLSSLGVRAVLSQPIESSALSMNLKRLLHR